MKKTFIALGIVLVISLSLLIVAFATDYNSTVSKDFTQSSWSVSAYDSSSTLRLRGNYSKTTTGMLWWEKTNYKATTTGYANYSRVYVASTLWYGSDWYFDSSETLTNGMCSASYTMVDKRPTKAQFYFRDGEDGYTTTYNTYCVLVTQS